MALCALNDFISFANKRVLHFAPDISITKIIWGGRPSIYHTADLEPGRASMVIDIEHMDIPDEDYDIVVCSHVLEHIDDTKALPELFRILRSNGQLIAMVPIIEGWHTTYEDQNILSSRQRELHFGQNDHVRYYGVDFRDRVKATGFSIDEFTAQGADSVKYSLNRGEKVFLCKKASAAIPN